MTNEQKQNLVEFVEALESGKYRQTKGVLNNGHCHCAAGVACDLFAERAGIEVEVMDDGTVLYSGSSFRPPSELYGVIDIRWGLVMLKNDQGQSFVSIAKFLREMYLD